MKVLVADKFEQSGLDGLKALGVEVEYQPDLKDQALGQSIRDTGAEVLVVRSTKVTAEMLEGTKLAVIIRAGAGYNTIDVAAASAQGIYVTNCPGKNSQAVAELAFGLILACDRHIPDNVEQLRAGKWNKKEFSKAKGLYGRTLGLVGMGKIAQEMIVRAKAFGMHVMAYSRWMTPDVAAALGIGRAQSLEELAQMSDVVSVHVSLTPDTRGLLGESFFNAMKPGTIFVNTSRAEVVDQDALEKAVEERGLLAGLDVFEGEPSGAEGAYEGSLCSNRRVYATHHIGASTEQAQEAVAAETVRIFREYLLTGSVPNVVNVRRGEAATHLLVVRHADRVGVLAHVLSVLKDEGVNVQEMENIVLGGAKAAIAQIALDKQPSDGALVAVKKNSDIFDASVLPMQRDLSAV
ncbi:MAG TPA: 3-phosphoglycerate dehydrogenase family protein [Fimbriimonadaceae bacterium]|nr:3-phosphoglycerate dehydrogenase family protein [Fimbriimonadaceae bacterium]